MPQEQDQPKERQKFKSLGEGFARKGQTVYVRLRLNGKLTWRSTGTSRLAQARKWREKWDNEKWNEKHGIESKGVTLQQSRVNVGELIDDYLEAGCPIIRKRSLKPKSQRTIRGEKYCFHPVREFFGRMPAGRLTLNDCDRYFDWRTTGGYITTFKVRSKEVTKRPEVGPGRWTWS